MTEAELQSLIVLRYLQLGIVPYYPGSGVLTKPDRKTKRKFRKVWKKAAKELNVSKLIKTKGKSPTPGIKSFRQKIVYKWIKQCVIKNK